jgi:DNA-binding LacI/PurR family transcriptional regulator
MRPTKGNKGVPAPVKSAPKPVGLKFLAEHLGLSRATISLVLNDSPVAKAISEATRERIVRAAKEFNYRPNYFARYLNNKRSYLVGVLVPEIGEGYDAGVLSGIERQLLDDKYFYFVASHQWRPDLIEETPRLLVERGAEGLVFVNTPLHHGVSVPAVRLGGREPFEGTSNIVIDNQLGTRLALEHLVSLGHRRIAFFKGHAGSADTEERWDGLNRAAQSLGIEVDPELVVQLDKSALPPGPSVPDEGYFFAQKLLARRRDFTALCAFNDVSAIGAMGAFRDEGLRLPEDMSVIGFDDVQAAAFVFPQLTTIRQPLRYMGELAAKTLLRRLESKDMEPEHILVEPELVVRKSTCAPSFGAKVSGL